MALRKKKFSAVSINDILPEFADKVSSPEDFLSEQQLIKDALSIVFEFKDNMQYVFLSRIYSEATYTDIAQQLNISESSAKVLFHRSKILLRKRLKEDYGYEI